MNVKGIPEMEQELNLSEPVTLVCPGLNCRDPSALGELHNLGQCDNVIRLSSSFRINLECE